VLYYISHEADEPLKGERLMRKAKVAGAIAWYLECPKCGGDVIDEDSGSFTHGLHQESGTLFCEQCNIDLAEPTMPKKIKVYQ